MSKFTVMYKSTRIILGLALMYAGLLMDQSMLNTVCVPLMTAANVLLIGV